MNFLRGFSIHFVCTGLTFAIGLANQAVIFRGLGKEGTGALTLIATFIMLAAMVSGEWLNRGNTYLTGKEALGAHVFANSLIYCLALGVTLCGTIAVLTLTGTHGALPGDWNASTVVSIGAIIVAVVTQKAVQAIALGQNRIGLYSLLPVLFIATYCAATITAIHTFDAGLRGVLNAWLAAAAASLVATVAFTRRRHWRTLAWHGAIFRRALAIGGRGATSSILIFLLFRSDVFLVEYFLDVASVGIYRVAIIMAEMMQRVPNIAGTTLLPRVLALQTTEGERLSGRVAGSMVFFSLFAGALIVAVGAQVIAIIFGTGSEAAYELLLWMLPGLIASGFGSIFNTELAARGYPPITIWAPAVALALNVALNIWLIPTHGLVGAAVATSVAYCSWTAIVAVGRWYRTSD